MQVLDARPEQPIDFQNRLAAFTKAVSTKAAIAQSPKELVWTLN